jgi:hypothetical protein
VPSPKHKLVLEKQRNARTIKLTLDIDDTTKQSSSCVCIVSRSKVGKGVFSLAAEGLDKSPPTGGMEGTGNDCGASLIDLPHHGIDNTTFWTPNADDPFNLL